MHARTQGRTWATLNALPHSSNSGGIKNGGGGRAGVNQEFLKVLYNKKRGGEVGKVVNQELKVWYCTIKPEDQWSCKRSPDILA